MAWLLRNGDVLAAIEDRRRGWPATLQGALILRPPSLIHTFGCPSALDLAVCSHATLDTGDRGFAVRRITSVNAHRLRAPLLLGGVVVAAPAGSFERWRLQVGDQLEIRAG